MGYRAFTSCDLCDREVTHESSTDNLAGWIDVSVDDCGLHTASVLSVTACDQCVQARGLVEAIKSLLPVTDRAKAEKAAYEARLAKRRAERGLSNAI